MLTSQGKLVSSLKSKHTKEKSEKQDQLLENHFRYKFAQFIFILSTIITNAMNE